MSARPSLRRSQPPSFPFSRGPPFPLATSFSTRGPKFPSSPPRTRRGRAHNRTEGRNQMNASKVVHEKDEDCTLDPETDECRECGVWHGDPVICCGGRGFHKSDCPDMEARRD